MNVRLFSPVFFLFPDSSGPKFLFRARLILLFLFPVIAANAQEAKGVELVPVGEGWSNNSVNAVIFRKNSLVSHGDTQFIAFYNARQQVVLGKRKLGEQAWQLKVTPFSGNASDAHNTISIMTDGAGYLHLSWDHHNHPLRYARSTEPGSLELTAKLPMTGIHEEAVSYPEFYRLPGGDLLFLYRDGRSGRGNLVVNRYHTEKGSWEQLHQNLISGEEKRNAYWQAVVDRKGVLHLSWVWRESPDVASNHDLAYARSTDGGRTWERSSGQEYALPVTAGTAEYACRIPQKSELINQTSMAADEKGRPYIASYWRKGNEAVPQYRIVYLAGKSWKTVALAFRKTPFSLSGGGTKRIPISRPQLLVSGRGKRASALLLFRDEERGSRASAVVIPRIGKPSWRLLDLMSEGLGSWEPSFDTELWEQRRALHLFIQKVEQVDGEGKADGPPQPVRVLQWKPSF